MSKIYHHQSNPMAPKTKSLPDKATTGVETKVDYNPRVFAIEEYAQDTEPYWRTIADERDVFRATYGMHRPLVLRGPTGSGKTTFSRRMHWELAKEFAGKNYTPRYQFDPESGLYVNTKSQETKPIMFPLYIFSGTEDTEIFQLLGGYNATGKYVGGPLYHWAHTGGVLLVNEIAEIRGDVQTVFFDCLDKDRTITFPDLAQIVELPDHALFICSYNPGLQSKREDLKDSTRQRLPALKFGYPADPKIEAEIIENASRLGTSSIDQPMALKLAELAAKLRGREQDKSIIASKEGVSTRLLVMAAEYIIKGISPQRACEIAIINPLTRGGSTEEKGLVDVVRQHFG